MSQRTIQQIEAAIAAGESVSPEELSLAASRRQISIGQVVEQRYAETEAARMSPVAKVAAGLTAAAQPAPPPPPPGPLRPNASANEKIAHGIAARNYEAFIKGNK